MRKTVTTQEEGRREAEGRLKRQSRHKRKAGLRQ